MELKILAVKKQFPFVFAGTVDEFTIFFIRIVLHVVTQLLEEFEWLKHQHQNCTLGHILQRTCIIFTSSHSPFLNYSFITNMKTGLVLE